jgi:hypothetical protein
VIGCGSELAFDGDSSAGAEGTGASASGVDTFVSIATLTTKASPQKIVTSPFEDRIERATVAGKSSE